MPPTPRILLSTEENYYDRRKTVNDTAIKRAETRQNEFTLLLTDYKTAVAASKAATAFDADYFIAVLGFLASIIALAFGCLCGMPNDIFGYIMIAIAAFLFAVVLLLQIRFQIGFLNPLYSINRRLLFPNKSLYKSATDKRAAQKSLRDGTLHFLSNDESDAYSAKAVKDIIATHSETAPDALDGMPDERLVEAFVKACGTEASIPLLKKVTDKINGVLDERKNTIIKLRRYLIVFSCLLSIIAIIGIILKFIF